MDQARQWLHDARRIAVLTGAGISAESGIPTFRGPGGLWRNFRPEDLATPEAFARDPHLVWEWYDWRRGLIAKAEPNAGHLALVELEKRVPAFEELARTTGPPVRAFDELARTTEPGGFATPRVPSSAVGPAGPVRAFDLITQNVDGLHRRAGSRNITCLHGDIWTLRCTSCSKSVESLQVPLDPRPPRCECGAMQRPGVVWFGEALPPAAWLGAEEAARQCDVFLIVGTSAVVMPAGGLATIAKRTGAKVIEVNAEETHLSAAVDASLRGPAGVILPQLLALPLNRTHQEEPT